MSCIPNKNNKRFQQRIGNAIAELFLKGIEREQSTSGKQIENDHRQIERFHRAI
jgi:hypothetical protein